MKIIDLLNKIANDEEVPTNVQYYNMLKGKTDIMMVCKENIFYKLDQLEIHLNSVIEPVEDKIPEIPKKISFCNYDDTILILTINEIIDYLKSKGE